MYTWKAHGSATSSDIMNKIYLIFGGILIIAVIGVVVLGGNRNQEVSSSTSEQTQSSTLGKAPDFSLKDSHGNTVNLADFEGKNIIVNSWAVWCPFCVKELEDFAKLQQEFGDEITIVAIDRAESLEKTKSYTDEVRVTDDLIFLLDPNDSFYRSIGGFSMPETIFVDGEENILFHKRGPMTFGEMKEKVEEIFNL